MLCGSDLAQRQLVLRMEAARRLPQSTTLPGRPRDQTFGFTAVACYALSASLPDLKDGMMKWYPELAEKAGAEAERWKRLWADVRARDGQAPLGAWLAAVPDGVAHVRVRACGGSCVYRARVPDAARVRCCCVHARRGEGAYEGGSVPTNGPHVTATTWCGGSGGG